MYDCVHYADSQEADNDPTGEAAQVAQQVSVPQLMTSLSLSLSLDASSFLSLPLCLQMLTFYELDLGLNHVVRKYSEPLEDTANMLIRGRVEDFNPLLTAHECPAFAFNPLLTAVPGGSDGPSGVLVCCENYLVYKNFGDQPDLRCPIPRRKVGVVCSLMMRQCQI